MVLSVNVVPISNEYDVVVVVGFVSQHFVQLFFLKNVTIRFNFTV